MLQGLNEGFVSLQCHVLELLALGHGALNWFLTAHDALLELAPLLLPLD